MCPHNMGAEIAVWPQPVPFNADRFRHIQHNRRGKHVLGAGELDNFFAGVALNIGSVDNGEPAGIQPLVGDIVEALKGCRCGALVGFVVGHQPPKIIGTQHFSRLKMFFGKTRLTATGRTDQRHHAHFGDFDSHLLNTPI